jgi:hypothetical protein
MTSVAFLADPLLFPDPGGARTYLRPLLPSLQRQDPSLEVRLFHGRTREGERPPDPLLRRFWTEELDRPPRSLYPRWNLTGRPALPSTVSSLDLMHTPSPAAIPPAGQGQRLVVTVHDVAFLVTPFAVPARWRSTLRMGLRATSRRRHHAVS